MANKKATLADIIERKQQGKLDKLEIKYYFSKTLDMDIEIRKIPLKKYMKLIEEGEAGDYVDGMNKIIYECCPMFKENVKEAMTVYEVSEPTDLPSAILSDQINEITEIIQIITKFYGIDNMEDIIKN